jgi:hypothetical protein
MSRSLVAKIFLWAGQFVVLAASVFFFYLGLKNIDNSQLHYFFLAPHSFFVFSYFGDFTIVLLLLAGLIASKRSRWVASLFMLFCLFCIFILFTEGKGAPWDWSAYLILCSPIAGAGVFFLISWLFSRPSHVAPALKPLDLTSASASSM